MIWWAWSLLAIHLIGFVLIFIMHAIVTPNVTIPLILLRSLLWPIWIATGWPHGAPMTMD